MVYKNLTELIGNTPLMEAVNIEKSENLKARLLLKLERFQSRRQRQGPCGIVDDRSG